MRVLPGLLTLCFAALPLLAKAGAEAALCEAALAAARQAAQQRGLQVQLACRSLAAPRAQAVLRLEAGDPPQPLRAGPLSWPVRVWTATGGSYVQQVPLQGDWWVPAWVAQRTLQAGSRLQAADWRRERVRWPAGRALPEAAPAEPLSAGRLRQRLLSGEVLRDELLMASDAVLRGERVQILLTQGAIELRLQGLALGDARVGQPLRVQADGRSDVLQGRLVDATTVVVEVLG